MRLFRGSDKLVLEPKYNFGKPYNDYGLGFYLTQDKDVAKMWASKNPSGGFLMEYEIDLSGLNILQIDSDDEKDVLKWITILVNHRFRESELIKYKDIIDELKNRYPLNIDEYDVIIGYRADDSYFQYSRDFIANELSLESLSKAMKLGKLGKQIVLKSEKSFARIKFVGYKKIDNNKDYLNLQKETNEYYHLIKRNDSIDNTFIRDILRRK